MNPTSERARRFRRELLPPAKSFYQRELGELGRPNRAGWAKPKVGCPFHKSEKKESFGVRLTDGYWHCFACDVGGSIVDFVMRRYGLSFKAATDDYLGAWDDHAPNKRSHRPTELPRSGLRR